MTSAIIINLPFNLLLSLFTVGQNTVPNKLFPFYSFLVSVDQTHVVITAVLVYIHFLIIFLL